MVTLFNKKSQQNVGFFLSISSLSKLYLTIDFLFLLNA